MYKGSTTLVCGVILMTFGCASMKEVKYTPKHRKYEEDHSQDSRDAQLSPGSLWEDGRAASRLFSDLRAMHENDVVVVRIVETANAARSVGTDLSRSTAAQSALSGFLQGASSSSSNTVGSTGAIGGAGPSFGAQIGGSSGSSFNGTGNSSRSEELTATVSAVVRKVLSSGNLFIEGHRQILVNGEEHHFYISGVVRPIDIDQQNSVASSMVADAEIEFTGEGDLTENARKGWLQRLVGYLWPF